MGVEARTGTGTGLRESLSAYAQGQLGEPERTQLTAHLDGCAECRGELADIAPVVAGLGGVDPDHLDVTPAPPPGLGEQIVSRTLSERRGGPRRGVLLAAAGVVVDAGAPYRVVVLDDTRRQVEAGGFVGTGSTRMLCNLDSTVLRAQAAGFDVLDPGEL